MCSSSAEIEPTLTLNVQSPTFIKLYSKFVCEIGIVKWETDSNSLNAVVVQFQRTYLNNFLIYANICVNQNKLIKIPQKLIDCLCVFLLVSDKTGNISFNYCLVFHAKI